jgi:kinesin family protein C1
LLPSCVFRSMGRTQMNEQSSRSHFVVTLRICGINEVHALAASFVTALSWWFISQCIYFIMQNTEQQVQGVLNLIDLAGSERLSRSGATGDSLKETQVSICLKPDWSWALGEWFNVL